MYFKYLYMKYFTTLMVQAYWCELKRELVSKCSVSCGLKWWAWRWRASKLGNWKMTQSKLDFFGCKAWWRDRKSILIWKGARRQRRIEMLLIVGSTTDGHCLSSDGGTGSRSPHLSEEERGAFATSSWETVMNCESVAGAEGGESVASGVDVMIFRWRVDILSVK